MSEYDFRVLTKDEVEQFKELRLAVVTSSPVGMGTPREEELQRPNAFFIEQLSFESPSCVFGAFSDERLVAAAGIRWPAAMRPSTKHVTIIYAVMTTPEHRGQGLARRLVQEAIKHGFAMGCRRIYLYVYLPNPHAVSLYESLGFVASGAEPEVLKIDGCYHDLLFMSLPNPQHQVISN